MNTTVLSYKYHKPYVIGVVCTNLAIVPGHCKKEDVSTASAVSSPKVRMRPLKLGIYKNVFLQVMHQLSTREMRINGFSLASIACETEFNAQQKSASGSKK